MRGCGRIANEAMRATAVITLAVAACGRTAATLVVEPLADYPATTEPVPDGDQLRPRR